MSLSARTAGWVGSSGARCGAVAGFGYVGLHWYRTIREAAVGAEKGYAALCRFSLSRTLVMGLGLLFLELAPVLLLVPLLLS